MTRPRLLLVCLALCSVWNSALLSQIQTKAETTNYVETSRYEDVVAFLNTVANGPVIERLRSHGIRMERLDQPTTVSLEEFHIAASQVAAQAFEKHQERTVTGHYEPIERTMPAGTYRIPMKQPGRPEDLDAAVVFLASEGSGYVTGQTLLVDGGISTGATRALVQPVQKTSTLHKTVRSSSGGKKR